MPWTKKFEKFIEYMEEYPFRLKILAVGDSWLDYPNLEQFFKNTNIVQHLGSKHAVAVYTIANSGEEAVESITSGKKGELLDRLEEYEFDLILFSGGGNDIVGKYDFSFFIKENDAPNSYKDYIIEDNFKLKLTQVISSYEVLIRMVKMYSKNRNIKILTHTYDIAVPAEDGAKLLDLITVIEPWIYPYLVEKGIDSEEDQEDIVRELLTAFKDELIKLQNKMNGDNNFSDRYEYRDMFHVVNTQGTLSIHQWINEIHPSSYGFKDISDKIYEDGLKELFPDHRW